MFIWYAVVWVCACVQVHVVCVCVCAGTHAYVYVDAHYGHDMDARGQPQVDPQESSILVFRYRVFH